MARRREINAAYRAALEDLPGVTFPDAAPDSEPSWWLTCLTLDPEVTGADRDELIAALDAADIEARPVWKPMHLQPVFAGLPTVGGEVAAAAFTHGVCLPSGSSLTAAEQDRVITCLRDRLA